MSTRLYSLDVLRGLDMFLLTVIGPLVTAHMSARLFPKSVLFAVALLGCGFAVGVETPDPKADPRACVARGAFAKEFARLKPFFEPAAVKKLAAWTGLE